MSGYKILAYLLLVSICINACQQAKQQHTFTMDDIVLYLEGPLFEGSNTVQAELKEPLKKFLESQHIRLDQISRITLKKASISVSDSADLNLMQSSTLQLAAENNDMLPVAVLNPIPKNTQKAELKLAGEQEKLVEILKQNTVFLVADAIIVKDTSANLEFKCHLEFEIESK